MRHHNAGTRQTSHLDSNARSNSLIPRIPPGYEMRCRGKQNSRRLTASGGPTWRELVLDRAATAARLRRVPFRHANPIKKQGAKNKIKTRETWLSLDGPYGPWQVAKLAVWDGSGGGGKRGCSGRSAIPRTRIPGTARAKRWMLQRGRASRRSQRLSGELSKAVWGNDARAHMQQAVCGLQ